MSDRTKDLYVALFRAIFWMAMLEWEWLDHIPAFRMYSMSGKVRVRYLTYDKARSLLEHLPVHQAEVVRFALATGLRQPAWAKPVKLTLELSGRLLRDLTDYALQEREEGANVVEVAR